VTHDSRGRRRRDVLRAAAAGGVASLAGCLGSVRDALGGDAGTDRDVLRFDTLDVGGSPGTTVPVRPPDRPALVDFFATWCGPCRPQMETLGRVRQRFERSELHMLSLTTEAAENAVSKFWRQYDGRWPVAVDPESEAVQRYSVKGIPTLVFVGPDGTEHWRHRGLAGFETLEREVAAVVDGAAGASAGGRTRPTGDERAGPPGDG
jgi:thiol-disulfide isomerase/thioredoxin